MPHARMLPRDQVHAWVDDIDANKGAHKNALNFLLQRQRALSKYVHDSAGRIGLGSTRNVLFIQGVILRIFDLGGKLGKITTEDIQDAERRVAAVVPEVMPLDDGFFDRVRAVSWRAQPHVIDECAVSLFDNPDLEKSGMAQLFFLAWIVIEAADARWSPSESVACVDSYVAPEA